MGKRVKRSESAYQRLLLVQMSKKRKSPETLPMTSYVHTHRATSDFEAIYGIPARYDIASKRYKRPRKQTRVMAQAYERFNDRVGMGYLAYGAMVKDGATEDVVTRALEAWRDELDRIKDALAESVKALKRLGASAARVRKEIKSRHVSFQDLAAHLRDIERRRAELEEVKLTCIGLLSYSTVMANALQRWQQYDTEVADKIFSFIWLAEAMLGYRKGA